MSDPLEELTGPALAALSPYRTPPDPLPIKLDANESPWAMPEDVRRAVADRVAEIELHRYPDIGARAVRRAIAERIGAAPDELVLGVGSDEMIGIALSALDRRRPGKERPIALFPTPSFVMYGITSRVQGFDPVGVPLDERWGLDLDAMGRAIAEHEPNLIFLATPNNPTGNAFDDDAIAEVVRLAPRSLVVIDEAYAPFAGRSLSDWVERYPNVATMGTLSKIGLAALRVGWLRLRAPLARELEKARPPYNLPTPSQVIAAELLTHHAAAIDERVTRIVEERERLAAALAELDGVTPYPSQSNFILTRVPDGSRWHEQLRAAGVQVRRFGAPRLADALRITVGTPEEDDRLLAALRGFDTL